MIGYDVDVKFKEIENKEFRVDRIINKVEGYLNNNFMLVNIEKASAKDILVKVEKMLDVAYFCNIDLIFNMITSGYYFDFSKVQMSSKFDNNCPNKEYVLEYDVTNLVLEHMYEIYNKTSKFMSSLYKLLSENSYADMHCEDITRIKKHFKQTIPLFLNETYVDRMIITAITRLRIRNNTLDINCVFGGIRGLVREVLLPADGLAEFINSDLLTRVVIPLVDSMTDIITATIYNVGYGIPNMFDNIYGYSLYGINIKFNTNMEK